jgi:hypothetical protein
MPYYINTYRYHHLGTIIYGRVPKNKLWAIEVKLTSNPSLQDFDSLNRAADLVGADKRVLVSQTTQSAVGKMQISCSLPGLLEMFVKPE